MSAAGALSRLARAVGIADGFTDAFGNFVPVTDETRRAILTGFGIACEGGGAIADSLAELAEWNARPVPAVLTVDAETPVRLRVASDEAGTFSISTEGGAFLDGKSDGEGSLALPPLSPGYHRFHLTCGGRSFEATIIAAPRECWQPRILATGNRLFGFAAQVYGLRSETNLGIGDFTDVARAAEATAASGASFLGLSPVHALFAADRSKISPYSPSSRLFVEPLHIDPTAIEGFAGSEAESYLQDPVTAEKLAILRNASLVNHEAVAALRQPMLDALWQVFQQQGRSAEFDAFRREGGDGLEAHATFEALSEHFWGAGRFWLGDWPLAYRRANSPEVTRFRAEHHERVAYHAWLQWHADRQLGAAHGRAKAAGMAIGLYRDLAVGADRGGSEIWSAPHRFAETLSAGAPPDPLGPQGQNWGLPPLNPFTLEREGLLAFRALVQANMRHAGAIRIDHAFQMQRLFAIPEGATAAQGAYVSYPFDAMLAVLRLESARARALVIAEDLGTAPEGFSDAIMASGLFSYRVLPFEREGDGAFKRPRAYPERALAALTTHDLPTFKGWWRGLDIDLRQSIGVFDAADAERERGSRAADRHLLAQALAEEKMLPDTGIPEEAPLEGSLRYLARTPSALLAVQFEDAAGELNQANLPGLATGHPNWCRRLSIDLATLTGAGGGAAKLSAALSAEGRGARARLAELASPPPRATYRIQFHRDFTFDGAVAIVPYLRDLGISHLYASPVHRARPGSTHGYDIVSHAEINPELGGRDGFVRLTDALREHGLGLILDIVPNHMGVGGADNDWWLSTLEWGQLSPHSAAFDIDWERLGAHGKLVVPFLGERYGEALEKGDLKLVFDAAQGAFSVFHYEHRFPISPLSYPIILDRALAALGDPAGHADAIVVSERLRAMDEAPGGPRPQWPEEAEGLKAQLAAAVAASPDLGTAIEKAVAFLNGVPGLPQSFGTLHRILEMQSYRLAHWRVAASEINYRRFFDINSLAGMRVENPAVFEATHRLVFDLVAEGRIQGLRIDHIDGLADPEGYARALQSAIGPGFFVLVEKILEPGEKLRDWPIAGTTGYDALNEIDGVLVDSGEADRFSRLYREFAEPEGGYGRQLRAAKTEIIETSFASELEVLVSDLKRIADADRRTRDFTVNGLRRALVEIIARFPVYRTYLGEDEPTAEDRALVAETVAGTKRWSALPDLSGHDFIAAALLGEIATGGTGEPEAEHVARFRRRFQQLTGPAMAKSLEDTLFYRYGRLLALNEVGGDPDHFGASVEAFHTAAAARWRDWPHAMIATATHDTKRGEDARARLLALPELGTTWSGALGAWRRIVAPELAAIEGEAAPDANDQYILLQAILGAWPLDLMHESPDAEALKAFCERIEGFAEKAIREAKRHSSWIHVNEPYEAATKALLRRLLQPGSLFMIEYAPLVRRFALIGAVNGLSRTVLKCTLPGIPDFYQGTEFWDFSLVDPDNRRPVDYAIRASALGKAGDPAELLAEWRDGRIKQYVIQAVLADRADHPALYADGEYAPLAAEGSLAEHVVAFTRRYRGNSLVVAAPRLIGGLVSGDLPRVDAEAWDDTRLPLEAGHYTDLLTGETRTSDGRMSIAELFATLPIAVLRAKA